jgi:hypothetical protein
MHREYSKEPVPVKAFQPQGAKSHRLIAPELNKV